MVLVEPSVDVWKMLRMMVDYGLFLNRSVGGVDNRASHVLNGCSLLGGNIAGNWLNSSHVRRCLGIVFGHFIYGKRRQALRRQWRDFSGATGQQYA